MSALRVGNPVSAALAYPLLAIHRRQIARGELTTVPVWVWTSMPARMQRWIDDRVLKLGQEYAWSLVDAHEVLGPLENRERNSWALSPSSRLFLWKTVHSRRPRRIIDFGSGKSTLLFATYASQMAKQGVDVQICTIENDATWLASVRNQLEERELQHFVTLVDAPLCSQPLLGRELVAYTVPEDVLRRVAGVAGFDFCLVDGPHGRVGRAGSLAIAAPYLAHRAVVLLDDAYREGEQSVARDWQRFWPRELRQPRLKMADRHGIIQFSWIGQPTTVRPLTKVTA